MNCFCRALADLVASERQWVATMVILVWVKLMDPLQAVFQDFFLLVKMIALMIGTVPDLSGSSRFGYLLGTGGKWEGTALRYDFF